MGIDNTPAAVVGNGEVTAGAGQTDRNFFTSFFLPYFQEKGLRKDNCFVCLGCHDKGSYEKWVGTGYSGVRCWQGNEDRGVESF